MTKNNAKDFDQRMRNLMYGSVEDEEFDKRMRRLMYGETYEETPEQTGKTTPVTLPEMGGPNPRLNLLDDVPTEDQKPPVTEPVTPTVAEAGVKTPTPEPKPLPKGLITEGNLDLNKRPVVPRDDGKISTVNSITVGFDDGFYVIPTVTEEGLLLDNDQAVEYFKKTGKHLGRFYDQETADAFAQQLHLDQEKMYGGQGESNGILNSIWNGVNRYGGEFLASMNSALWNASAGQARVISEVAPDVDYGGILGGIGGVGATARGEAPDTERTNLVKGIDDWVQSSIAGFMPRDQTRLDEIIQGFGSAAGYYAPGLAFNKLFGAAATALRSPEAVNMISALTRHGSGLAPSSLYSLQQAQASANALSKATVGISGGVMEGLSEAVGVFDDAIKNGMSKEDAFIASMKNAITNIPIASIANMAGAFGEHKAFNSALLKMMDKVGLIKRIGLDRAMGVVDFVTRTISGGVSEFVQETEQGLSSEKFSTGKPWSEILTLENIKKKGKDQGVVGGIVGSTLAALLGGGGVNIDSGLAQRLIEKYAENDAEVGGADEVLKHLKDLGFDLDLADIQAGGAPTDGGGGGGLLHTIINELSKTNPQLAQDVLEASRAMTPEQTSETAGILEQLAGAQRVAEDQRQKENQARVSDTVTPEKATKGLSDAYASGQVNDAQLDEAGGMLDTILGVPFGTTANNVRSGLAAPVAPAPATGEALPGESVPATGAPAKAETPKLTRAQKIARDLSNVQTRGDALEKVKGLKGKTLTEITNELGVEVSPNDTPATLRNKIIESTASENVSALAQRAQELIRAQQERGETVVPPSGRETPAAPAPQQEQTTPPAQTQHGAPLPITQVKGARQDKVRSRTPSADGTYAEYTVTGNRDPLGRVELVDQNGKRQFFEEKEIPSRFAPVFDGKLDTSDDGTRTGTAPVQSEGMKVGSRTIPVADTTAPAQSVSDSVTIPGEKKAPVKNTVESATQSLSSAKTQEEAESSMSGLNWKQVQKIGKGFGVELSKGQTLGEAKTAVATAALGNNQSGQSQQTETLPVQAVAQPIAQNRQAEPAPVAQSVAQQEAQSQTPRSPETIKDSIMDETVGTAVEENTVTDDQISDLREKAKNAGGKISVLDGKSMDELKAIGRKLGLDIDTSSPMVPVKRSIVNSLIGHDASARYRTSDAFEVSEEGKDRTTEFEDETEASEKSVSEDKSEKTQDQDVKSTTPKSEPVKEQAKEHPEEKDVKGEGKSASKGTVDFNKRITFKFLKKAFPKEKVYNLGKGLFKIIGRNGKTAYVALVKRIDIDTVAFKKANKRLPTPEEMARGGAGSSELLIDGTSLIQITADMTMTAENINERIYREDSLTGEVFETTRGTEMARTIFHESYHTASDMVLSKKEKALLNEKYGSEEAQADAYMDWLLNREIKSTTGRIFQRIFDFFSRVRSSLLGPDSESVFVNINRGNAWSRESGAKKGDTSYRIQGSLRLDDESLSKKDVETLKLIDDYFDWKPPTKGEKDAKVYLGAPEWIKTEADIEILRKDLRQLLDEGVDARFWYEESGESIFKYLGLNGKQAREAAKFVQVLAIFSPNSDVEQNTGSGIKAWEQYKRGVPESEFHVGMPIQDAKAIQVLYHDALDFDGRKTSSFYENLMYIVLKDNAALAKEFDIDIDLLKATVDLWVYRAFGYKIVQGGNDKGSGKYSFCENHIRQLTAELNRERKPGEPIWTPHQVQAAIWTAIKTRWESAITREAVANENKERSKGKLPLLNEVEIRNLAMTVPDTEYTKAEVSKRKASFADYLKQSAFAVTWEAIPSESIGAEINNASVEVKRDFTQKALSLLLDKDGNDILAKKLGIEIGIHNLSSGAYAGGVNPNVITEAMLTRIPEIGINKKTGELEIKQGYNHHLDLIRSYARAIQYIMKQNAVPWSLPRHLPFASKSAIEANKFRVVGKKADGSQTNATRFESLSEAREFAEAQNKKVADAERKRLAILKKKMDKEGKAFVEKDHAQKVTEYSVFGGNYARATKFSFTKDLTDNDLVSILKVLTDSLGEDTGFTQLNSRELVVVNFRSDDTKIPFGFDDDSFLDIIEKSESDLKAIGLADKGIGKYWTESEYGPVHDWETDPEGGDILDQGTASRRSDIQEWCADRRKDFEGLLKEYSGENLRNLEKTLNDRGGVRGSGPEDSTGKGTKYRVGVATQTTELPFTVEPDGSVRLFHWGKDSGLTTLDPKHHGSGISGAERKRRDNNSRAYVNRIYYGVNGGGYVKEPRLSNNKYETSVKLEELYDFTSDPEGFLEKGYEKAGPYAHDDAITYAERLISEAGYKGLWVNTRRDQNRVVAILFTPTEVKSVPYSEESLPSEEGTPKYRISDREYLSAVEAGDMETAQRMVDEAAKEAGYGIGPVYHGTNSEFNTFDRDKVGKNYGKETPDHIGFFFTNRKEGDHPGGTAKDWARQSVEKKGGTPVVVGAYLKINNPFTISDYAASIGDDIETIMTYAGDRQPVVDIFDNDSQYILNKSMEMGKDGIVFVDDFEGDSDGLYVAFEPEQIKSADPIVMDDHGNVISLSERFNSKKPDIRYRVAYHGSPYEFTSFSKEHINTGEGYQMYGWGLYFAEEKKVADKYRKQLAEKRSVTVDGKPIMSLRDAMPDHPFFQVKIIHLLKKEQGDVDRTIKRFEKDLISLGDDAGKSDRIGHVQSIEFLESLRGHTVEIGDGIGQLYEVNIPEEDVLLDLDATFDDQPWYVHEAIRENGILSLKSLENEMRKELQEIMDENSLDEYDALLEMQKRINSAGEDGDLSEEEMERYGQKERILISWFEEGSEGKGYALTRTGWEIYSELADHMGGPKEASEYLDSIGIKGLRYLDAGSRSDGDGTRNFVIFDDETIDIAKTHYRMAFHATRAKFDRPSMAHVGSGLGENTYGWGLYVTHDESYADALKRGMVWGQSTISMSNGEYRKRKVSGIGDVWTFTPAGSSDTQDIDRRSTKGETLALIDEYMQSIGDEKFDPDKLIEEVSYILGNKRLKEGSKLNYYFGRNRMDFGSMESQTLYRGVMRELRGMPLKSIVRKDSEAYKYTMEIPEADVMLNWGVPLSEQPKPMIDALNSMDDDTKSAIGIGDGLVSKMTGEPMRVEELIDTLDEHTGSSRATSLYLNSLGIEGIDYGTRDKASQGRLVTNSVIFNAEAIKNVGIKYRLKGGMSQSSHPITAESIRKNMPGMKVYDFRDGIAVIGLWNGNYIAVDTEREIPTGSNLFFSDIGPRIKYDSVNTDQIHVIDGNKFVSMVDGISRDGVMTDEAFEFARDMILKENESARLDKKYGSIENQKAMYRKFLGMESYNPEGINEVFIKMREYFTSLRNKMFGENSSDVVKKIALEGRGEEQPLTKSLIEEWKTMLVKDANDFRDKVKEFIRNGGKGTKPITMMVTPVSMWMAQRQIGIRDPKFLPITIEADKLRKILFEKHSDQISEYILSEVPKALAEPMMILRETATENGKKLDDLTFVLMLKDKNGSTVNVILGLNKTMMGDGGTESYIVNYIKSVYARSRESTFRPTSEPIANNQWYLEQANSGRLLYIDTDMARMWGDLSGLKEGVDSLISREVDEEGRVLTQSDLEDTRTYNQSGARYRVASKAKQSDAWKNITNTYNLEEVIDPTRAGQTLKERISSAWKWWKREMIDDISGIKEHFGKDIYIRTTNAIHGINSRAEALIRFGEKGKGVKGLYEIFDTMPVDEQDGFMHYAVYKHLQDIAENTDHAIASVTYLEGLADDERKIARDYRKKMPLDPKDKSNLEHNAKLHETLADEYQAQADMARKQIHETRAKADDYKNAIAGLEKQYPHWKNAQKDLAKYSRYLLWKLQKSGIISKNLYDVLVSRYPNYIPLQRDFGEEGAMESFSSSRGIVNLTSPIKKLKGSRRDVKDPLFQIVSNTYAFEGLIGKQNAAVKIAEMADQGQLAGLVDPTDDRRGTPGEYVFHVWEDGKKKFYKTDQDIYTALVMSSRDAGFGGGIDVVLKILSIPVRVLRAGVTHGVGFILRNPMRDTVNAGMVGDHFTPIVSTLKGAFSLLSKKDGWFEEFMKSGAMQGVSYLSSKTAGDIVKSIRMGKGTTKFMNKMKNPVRAIWDLLGDVAQFTELATRVGQYRVLRERGVDMGKAAYESRDLLNYQRGGRVSRAISKVNPFFNAQVQGVEKGLRSMYHDGKIDVKSIARGMLYITLPSMLVTLWNYGDDDRRKKYLSIPAWQRNLFWNIVIGEGDDAWILKLPKPFDLGLLFGSIPERAMDYLYADDPKAFDDLGSSVLDAVSPETVPLFLGTVVEWMANYSFFRQSTIVPMGEQNLEGKLQYGPYTSEIAKWAGERFNISPRKIDHLISQTTGNLGKEVSGLIDKGVRAVKDETRPARDWYQEVPGVASFAVPAKAMKRWEQVFYDERNDLDKQLRSAKRVMETRGRKTLEPDEKRVLGSENAIKRVDRYFTGKGGINDLKKDINKITVAPKMSAEEKKRRIDMLQKRIAKMVERGLKDTARIRKSLSK